MAAPRCILLFAEAVKDPSQIVGLGATSSGELHGFLAIQSHGTMAPMTPLNRPDRLYPTVLVSYFSSN
jgi:hypothetical protein